MAYFIPISQLNTQSVLTFGDFIPIVQSSSLTTYKINIQTLYDFLGIPQFSCSWVSQSFSSSYSLSSSYPSYPEISCSWTNQSFSSSYAVSASWAPSVQQIRQQSCSLSISESVSSSYAVSASWAQQIFYSSMSFATSSISSSYVVTASWAPITSTPASPFQYLNFPTIIKTYDGTIPLNNSTIYYISKTLIPFTTGVILQVKSNADAGAAGYLYASSSVMPKQIVGAFSHSSKSSIFYANIGPDNKLYILFQLSAGSIVIKNWGVNIIGYY